LREAERKRRDPQLPLINSLSAAAAAQRERERGLRCLSEIRCEECVFVSGIRRRREGACFKFLKHEGRKEGRKSI
jgi:hypothetical protein